MLQTTIENKRFINVFNIMRLNNTDSIILIDTGNIIGDCNIKPLFGKNIIVYHKLLDEKKGNIINIAVGIKNDVISVGYLCTYSGGYVAFDFIKKRKKIKLIRIHGTDF